jgi:glycosyltransferase involved in cell wall biosynthesis
MKIAIDARWIFPALSGIGVYTRELIRALAQIDGENHYRLLFQHPDLRDRTAADTGFRANPRFETALVPYGLFTLRNQALLPGTLRRFEADVFHSPNYMMPLLPAAAGRPRPRRVVTIHDVIPLMFPDHAPKSRKSRLFPLYRLLMLAIGRRADRIITVTEASRADVIRQLRIGAPEKVRAIHNGVAAMFSPAERPRSTDPQRPRSVLYVGRSDPYKNVAGLVRAFARLKALTSFPLRLRLAGARDARYPAAADLARQLGVAGDLEWLEALSQEELLAAYRAADVLALPSRYEGFGLPALEAMACGVPLVCGDCGALREVAADVALFAAPDDIEGLAQALRRLLTDPPLAAELARRGIERARLFDWRRTAAQTLDVYRQALA